MKFSFLLPFCFVLTGCAVQMTKNPTNPAEHLGRAAENGDLVMVKKLLADGVEPAPNRFTDGIEVADYKGHHEIVKLLVDRCMQIFVPGKNCGSFPFWIAYKGDAKKLTTLFTTKRVSANQADGTGTPILIYALANDNPENARLLLARGADPDKTMEVLQESTRKLEAIDHHTATEGIARNDRSIALLQKLKAEGVGRIEADADDDEENFKRALKAYQRSGGKMALPEEARKFKVQAEDAVNDKNFEEAADLYAKALNLALWWPEGHFNRALVLGEGSFYEGAIREMKRYLALVPKAPDARAAQDKIYMWERKVGK